MPGRARRRFWSRAGAGGWRGGGKRCGIWSGANCEVVRLRKGFPGEQGLDLSGKVQELKGLIEVVASAVVEELLNGGALLSGQEQDLLRGEKGILLNVPEKLLTRHLRHSQIAHHQVEVSGGQLGEGFLAVLR